MWFVVPLFFGELLTAAMRNFRVTLGYDGSDFHGWQIQPGLRTVQQTLEEALARLTGEAQAALRRLAGPPAGGRP